MWDQKVPECYWTAELVLELTNLQRFTDLVDMVW
jgi:hypothetical protein